jgi:hypothetical protein
MGFLSKTAAAIGQALVKGFGEPAAERGASDTVMMLAGAQEAKELYRRDDGRLTLSHSYLRQLHKMDADTWAIVDRVKTRIKRLAWSVVPDLGSAQKEFDSWEQRVALWLSPWADGEAFPSLAAQTIPLEVGSALLTRIKKLSRADADARRRARWAFDLAKADAAGELAPACAEGERFLKACNSESDTPFEALMDRFLEDLLVLDCPCVAVRPNEDGGAFDAYCVPGHEVVPYVLADGTRPQPPAFAFARKVGGKTSCEYVTDFREAPGSIAMVRVVGSPVGEGHWGMSPVEAAAFVIAASMEADRFNFEKFSSNLPAGIVALGAALMPEQVKQFRLAFESDALGRQGGRSSVHFMNMDKDKAGLIPFNGLTPKDLDFQEYRKWTLRVKCACFGISTQDVGEIADAKYETSSNQLRISGEGVEEAARLVEQGMTAVLDRALGTEGRVRFKLKRDDSLDTSETASRDAALIDKGVLSVDEAREKRGMAPLPVGGDAHMIITKRGATPVELIGSGLDFEDEEPEAPEGPDDEEEDDEEEDGEKPGGPDGRPPVDGGGGARGGEGGDAEDEKGGAEKAAVGTLSKESPARRAFGRDRMRDGKARRNAVLKAHKAAVKRQAKALARKAMRGIRGVV